MSTSTNLDERSVSSPADTPAPETAAELATASADERAARALLAQAGAILHERAADVPDDFAAQLLGRAAAEDLIRYEAAELADIAASTWRFLAERKPRTAKIRVTTAPPEDGPRLKNVSIIELVNDDMPFLVDSVMGALTERGLDTHLLVHPVLTVERDPAGALIGLSTGADHSPAALRESLIQIHVDRIDDEATKSALIAALADVLADVRHAVEDWRPMVDRVASIIDALKADPPALPEDEVAEGIQFLEWLKDNNFTFLGVRDYRLAEDGNVLDAVPNSSLGVLRGDDGEVITTDGGRIEMSPRAQAAFQERRLLFITKTNARSRVHRRVAMDLVGVKHYDRDGRPTGGFQIVGLFTATAYTRSTRNIPYLRRKVASVLARAGFSPNSHSGRTLTNVLDTYPRDELFQIDEDTLFHFASIILQLSERPRVRVLPRYDWFERFVSVLVYVPREPYGSGARAVIGRLLASAFNGEVAWFLPYFPEGPLVRVHFIIAQKDGALAHPDRTRLESDVSRVMKTWPDLLLEALAAAHDPIMARDLFARYGGAFSATYRDAFAAATAVQDIATLEAMSADAPLGVDFQRGAGGDDGAARLKLWSHGRPLPLSERVPVLEHMGFRVVDESTYHAEPGGPDERQFWLHDMLLEFIGDGAIDFEAAKGRLDDCFAAVMCDDAENDGYNALVLVAGLTWRQVALLRTLSRYLRQISVPYSQDYMWSTLVKHAGLAARISALFETRFDPRLAASPPEREERQGAILAEIDAGLAKVASLDEDRILRHFVNAVTSALRTNYYQTDRGGDAKPVIALKFDSRKVDSMPLPRPRFEIFLCSPRLEAVHLRFGPVARGGIRWSDRPQDFRTEILGLVKAQQVKNAVIVPVGAKGGFIPKHLPVGNRDAIQGEGVATYRIFMSTMLDMTDNLDLERVVPPTDLVRHDGDDPYLVVAADKGTATFSDIANDVAREHGFWLDDAFASGGSTGYDHKKMGITARGAWESVKRHFREMNVDLAASPFTVVGVGDMSGDVFGNGMLRERTIKLVAAFDHRDIFIDPDPEPELSFKERQRLFNLPRSSWQDYDRYLISPGGGVYSRSAKEITLSAQARAALGLPAQKMTPQEIMNAILRAPVDLLWFGGIGTYVKASNESNEAVGDRANDAIRAAGSELRCKVIGEGANLGMTQRGRIEAAFHGVRLNTDAIDNSAGVNTSDVEVNLKIALSIPLRDGRLQWPERDALLASMTDEVAALVLRNNYQQTLAISLVERRGLEDLGFQQRLMQTLEKRQLLDRAVEFLPDDMEIAERRRRASPLTRPEIAVLLAYAKLSLHADLLNSSVPDDPYLARELGRYFPPSISSRFPDALERHRLRRDIISTGLANSMINRGGPTLVVRIADQTGATVDRIAGAFAAVRDSFGLTALNTEIEELDGKIAGMAQLTLFVAVQNLLLDRIVWFLRNVDLGQGLAGIIAHYQCGIAEVADALERLLPEDATHALAARADKLAAEAVPDELAQRLAMLPALAAAADAVLIADRTGKPVTEAAQTYFAAIAYFQLDRVVGAAGSIKVTDYFDRLALDRALDTIGDAMRRIAAEMTASGSGAEAVAAWVTVKGGAERVRQAVHEIAASGLTLSKLSVAASMLADLARTA
jgi:glutamate dehydrogenase